MVKLDLVFGVEILLQTYVLEQKSINGSLCPARYKMIFRMTYNNEKSGRHQAPRTPLCLPAQATILVARHG